ncbi:HAMP domain-containing sensor histidine kinase [Sutterella sp.]|uniref:sensor histidine kinase n=1 Tax=Sutterella sp. TaxID=1981025 RepID=UPI0026E0DA12|nr:HAMP domain-containing sensor histidine kinase [Sutterella sp.]MDO5530767.1 HAMP domain-containing sensor histidine kinase [Sutterella sp.]
MSGASHRPARGLSQRIALAFALLLALVASLYAIAVISAIGFTERELLTAMLEDELTNATAALSRGEMPRETPSLKIYGDAAGLAPVPAAFRSAPRGFSEITESPAVFILRGVAADGATIMVVRDQEAFEEKETQIFILIGISILVVVGLGGLAGTLLSRRVMRPVEELSRAVRRTAEAPRWEPLPAELQTRDEVGELARICSEAMRRLSSALKRERAFTGDVSHELRTPLTVIETGVELLSMTQMNERQQAQLARIERAATEMRALLELFLEFARTSGRPGEDAPDTVTGIIRRAEYVWRPFAEEKGLELVVKKSGKCPGDYSPGMLGIVIANLLKNAVTYTDSGSVTVEETPTGVIVSDTGTPIPEADRERIFLAFERGADAKAGKGAGLGLSIVRRVSARMGWTVALAPARAGGGNSFELTLVTGRGRLRADEAPAAEGC